jgi:chromosome segregation ATPase
MAETQEVVFDEKTGISLEEQKEILFKINTIAERNRKSLSQGAHGANSIEVSAIKAKKSGAFFPLAVNIAAVVILAAGVFILISFNGKKDAQVREGTAVFNLTERALIEEIRKDTADKIASKEREIAFISSRLEEVDAQLMQLYSSNQELTAEQLSAQGRLLSMQVSFRADLSALNEERSQILEDSRSREARLRALLDERAREFAAAQQKTASERDSAVSELERLTGEQERAAASDAQLSGGLAAIAALVQDGRYDQASQSAESLRLLNNNSAVSSTRSYQSRREFYNRALDSVETMIAQLRKNTGADSGREHWDLQVTNAQLEDKIAEMQKTIDAFSAGSSGQALRLSEMEQSLSSLRAANASLQTAAAEKDRTINSLETEKASLTQTAADLRSANSAQEQEITVLRSRINNILQAAQE